jgi:hypothetical protein
MLGLSHGELFVVTFVVVAVVSARWWPLLGAFLGETLASRRGAAPEPPSDSARRPNSRS